MTDAQKDLGFSNGDRQWVITAYTLAFGSLLLLSGRIIDLFGRRRTFLVGLLAFAAASLLGGLSPTFAVLVLARALQEIKHYSPVMAGLAFLPMVAALMTAAAASTIKLLPKFGPRVLAFAGLLIAGGGMLWLTRIGLHCTYAASILGPLLMVGFGSGAVMAPSMNTATAGVRPTDAGIASATIQTMQQIGGSMGTALLNSLAASALSAYLRSRRSDLRTAATPRPTPVRTNAAPNRASVRERRGVTTDITRDESNSG